MAEKLLNQLRSAIRVRNYSIRTEQAYSFWVKRYIRFHDLKHPGQMGEPEVVAFLTHLAVERNVSANTQNLALSALVFLYKHILDKPLGDITKTVRAKKPQKLPSVLTREEVAGVLRNLEGSHKLIASMLYGSGLRLTEALRLRIKDLNFTYACIQVNDAKGAKDRVVTFPEVLHRSVHVHLERVKILHDTDLLRDNGAVHLPGALYRKYPTASKSWPWQFVFPARRISRDPRSNHVGRPFYFSERVEGCNTGVWYRKASQFSHLSPFVRNPCAGKWRGYQNRTTTTGAFIP